MEWFLGRAWGCFVVVLDEVRDSEDLGGDFRDSARGAKDGEGLWGKVDGSFVFTMLNPSG